MQVAFATDTRRLSIERHPPSTECGRGVSPSHDQFRSCLLIGVERIRFPVAK